MPIVASPKFRLRAVEIRNRYGQVIDIVTPEQVTRAEFNVKPVTGLKL